MVDYYSILLRAMTAPGAGDARWRRDIYERSRQMLAERMRGLKPQPPLADVAAEEARLEAAIERVEAELTWAEEPRTEESRTEDPRTEKTQAQRPRAEISAANRSRTVAAAPPPRDDAGEFAQAPDEAESGPLEESGFPRMALIAAAVVVAALGAGGYIFFAGKGQKSAPASTPALATTQAATSPQKAAPSTTPDAAAKLAAVTSSKNGELAPGVDGGGSDPDLQYIFRRQPTFYRTLQPVGTIIVDKLQHFLYLIQPNNVALRYGIAVGGQCSDLAGMRHISTMAEWPPWQPPSGTFNRDPNPMPGGPGNPLGARMLQLDDGNSRINGTNAPKTIGNMVAFGCIRLSNDDITDLYGRVKLSTPVVVN